MKTGGKQYHVKVGDVIKVDKINSKQGEKITFTEILVLYNRDKSHEIELGKPFVKLAKVNAKVLEQMKDTKIIVFKKKRRKNYRKKKGHRQLTTVLKITKVEG